MDRHNEICMQPKKIHKSTKIEQLKLLKPSLQRLTKHCALWQIRPPSSLKLKEAVRIYNLKKGRGNQTHEIDREVELKYWQHPADEDKTIETDEHKDQKNPCLH